MAKRARKALGMSQVDFAKLLATSRSTVERWERDGVEGPALALMALIIESPQAAHKVIRRVMNDESLPEVPIAPRGRAATTTVETPGAPAWPGAVSTGARPTARSGAEPSRTRVDVPADASFSGPPPPASRPAEVEPARRDAVRCRVWTSTRLVTDRAVCDQADQLARVPT